MADITISPATEEEVRSGDIGRRLRHFNYSVVGEYPETQYVRLNARDADGRVVGGLRGFVFVRWLRIEVLFVDEGARRSGTGSALLREGERLGRELGAKNAILETFEWQAPDFYRKHGYAEASRIDDFLGGSALITMRKAL